LRGLAGDWHLFAVHAEGSWQRSPIGGSSSGGLLQCAKEGGGQVRRVPDAAVSLEVRVGDPSVSASALGAHGRGRTRSIVSLGHTSRPKPAGEGTQRLPR
jgi:hypothetical protein